jgi:hypothetical protein
VTGRWDVASEGRGKRCVVWDARARISLLTLPGSVALLCDRGLVFLYKRRVGRVNLCTLDS